MKSKFCFKHKEYVKRAAALLLLTTVLASCTDKPKPSTPSNTVGVGRAAELVGGSQNQSSDENTTKDNSAETSEKTGESEKEDDEDGSTVSSGGSFGNVSWSIVNGKYTYTVPEPDRSGLSDLSDVNSVGNALFSDQGDDSTGAWYYGKTEYNADTGEVTYVWDRAADTLEILKENHGIYRGDETRKVCYFTFDCGYENGYTDKILDILQEKSVPGVFFLTGHYVETAQEQIKRMIDEGHLLGNHTVNHTNMTQVTATEFIEEIEGLENLVKTYFPNSDPILYFRPPYGAANEWTLKMASKMGLRTVMWSYTYKDYDPDDQLDPAAALEKCKSGLHPGAVFLFHAVSSTNASILGDFIDWVRDQGYEILPICDIE